MSARHVCCAAESTIPIVRNCSPVSATLAKYLPRSRSGGLPDRFVTQSASPRFQTTRHKLPSIGSASCALHLAFASLHSFLIAVARCDSHINCSSRPLGIIDGTVHPFAGPISNQAGEVAVAEGETLSDEDLLKMDWYVEGVQA